MQNTPRPAHAWALALALLLACSSPARADDGAGAFRLGLGVDVFDWHTQDWWRTAGSNSHRDGFDLALGSPSFGLQLAGQVTPEIAIGATVGIAWGTQSETSLPNETAVGYDVHALAEYAAWPGTFARPFVRANVGFGGGESDHLDPSHYSVVLFEAAGAIGVHLFPARSVSLSPYARFDYATGPGWETRPPSTTSLTTSYVAISVGVELIAWLGGAAPEVHVAPEPTEDIGVAAAPTWQGGLLRTRVVLFGGTRGGVLSAAPSDPRTVHVRFSTTHSELAGCQAIDVVVGETRTSLPLTVQPRATGSRTRFVLRFDAPSSTVALLASRRASLEACTRRFELSFDSSRTVLAFLASLLAIPAVTSDAVVIPPAPIEPVEEPAEEPEVPDAPGEPPASSP